MPLSCENSKKLFLFLIEQNDYTVYVPLLPGDCTCVLHKNGFPPLRCYPALVCLTAKGPRGSLNKHDLEWQLCDAILFFEKNSNSVWLVPVLSIPGGASVLLGPRFDEYRIIAHSTKPDDLQALLNAASNAAGIDENALENKLG